MFLKSQEGNSCDIRYPSVGDRIFYAINNILCIVFGLIVLIPLLHVLASSFSQPAMVNQGKVFIWPVKFTTIGYERVFTYPNLWNSYKNTIINTVVGTTLNLVMTVFTAYPLSVKTMPFRKCITTYFIITMYISAGLIPIYLVIRSLGLINTWWVMIIPMAMNCSNVIIMRTFFQGIPTELQEAAMLDGCSHFQYLTRILLPISVTVIAVIGMFYAVDHWNRYFEAIMYLNDDELYTLQVILRAILTLDNVDITAVMDETVLAELTGLSDLLKYAVIVVSTVPILCLYPFLQKYYVKGIMLGSVKG